MRKLKPGEKRCKRCSGSGMVRDASRADMKMVMKPCPVCSGSGVQPNHDHPAFRK